MIKDLRTNVVYRYFNSTQQCENLRHVTYTDFVALPGKWDFIGCPADMYSYGVYPARHVELWGLPGQTCTVMGSTLTHMYSYGSTLTHMYSYGVLPYQTYRVTGSEPHRSSKSTLHVACGLGIQGTSRQTLSHDCVTLLRRCINTTKSNKQTLIFCYYLCHLWYEGGGGGREGDSSAHISFTTTLRATQPGTISSTNQ